MKTKDALAHFGTATAVAVAARISKAAVSQWGVLVPLGTAALLEKATGGKLRMNPAEYRRRPLPAPAEDRAA